MKGSTALRLVAALVVFALAIGINLRLERDASAARLEHSLYLPSGRYLRHASLGYRNLLADALYVWSIQYYSTERADRWRLLENLYDVITDLDPRFVVGYSIGALILAIEANDGAAALRLLDKGIAANPDTFLLAFEAGFYARDAKDWTLASRYFSIAKDKPDAPSFVARWHAYTLDRAGDRKQALKLWSDIQAHSEDAYARQVAERHIQEIQLELQIESLESAVERFRAERGALPRRLEDLVSAGYLSGLPGLPEGKAINYDAATGTITAPASFLSKHRIRN